LAAELGKADQPKAKSVKRKTKSKAVAKKSPVTAAKKTDTDMLLAVINRYKKGVDTATLMKKTGFNQKKVRNMLNRTYKQGKITRVGKGIYVSVK
jgi:predicted transcriptional regulator of viral defense system